MRAASMWRGSGVRRRSNLLRHRDAVVAAPKPALLGHNGGPPLDDDDPAAAGWRAHCWQRAHARAWKTPPAEIAARRLARAEALGLSYRTYTLEILERGRYL